MQCHYGWSSSNRSTLGPSTEHGVISFRHKGVPYVPFFGLGISYEECIIIGTKFKLYLMWSLPQCVNSVLLLLFFFFTSIPACGNRTLAKALSWLNTSATCIM